MTNLAGLMPAEATPLVSEAANFSDDMGQQKVLAGIGLWSSRASLIDDVPRPS
jgi:hypothetical protein